MTTIRKSKTAALALAVILATAGSAMAANAVAKSAVNVRTGPSTSYAKVDTLSAGEHVDVKECQSGWCYVEHSGPDGWVAGNYLAKADAPAKKDPDVNFKVDIGPDGVSFGFGVGDSSINFTPPTLPVPKVCVYNGTNFTGSSTCWSVGHTDNSIGGYWNDRISSVKVEPGATITLCRKTNFNGYCKTYTSNKVFLPPMLNNKASSVEVY